MTRMIAERVRQPEGETKIERNGWASYSLMGEESLRKTPAPRESNPMGASILSPDAILVLQ